MECWTDEYDMTILTQLAMEIHIGASEFTRFIEQAFIRAVEQEAASTGRPQPGPSAVAARTGLTRQRVSQLRSSLTGGTSVGPEPHPQPFRILSALQTDPQFSDSSRSPQTL